MRINTTEDSQVGCVQAGSLKTAPLIFCSIQGKNEFHTLFTRFDPNKSNTILLWLVFIIMFLGVAFPRAKMKARISLVLLTLTGKKIPV